MRGTTGQRRGVNASLPACALLLALLVLVPVGEAGAPRLEYRPYNVGVGAWAACPGDIVIASAGGVCFLLDGSESSADITVFDSTFAQGVPAVWEFDTGATGTFCDTVTVAVPMGATALRVWIGTLSEAAMAVEFVAGSMQPPCMPGLASTGLVEASFT